MDDAVVDSFMEVTSCDSRPAALPHLANCSWRLEAAIDRYFTFGLDDRAPFPPVAAGTMDDDDDDDMVRDPIRARFSTLYGYDDYFHGAGSSTARAAPSIWAADRAPPSPWAVHPVPVEDAYMADINTTGWESEGDTGVKEKEETKISDKGEQVKQVAEKDSRKDEKEAMEEDEEEQDEYSDEEEQDDDAAYLEAAETDSYDGNMDALEPQRQNEKSLDELFRPPKEIMYKGSFHEAKGEAATMDRWLLVNLQSHDVFASHLHNRDLWSNEVVAQVIKDNFVFSLQQKAEEGGDQAFKVCCFYNVRDHQLPAVLVVDPITGQLMDKWCGFVQQPDDFLTSIGKFTQSKPSSGSKPKVVRTTATVKIGESSAAQEPAMPASDAQQAPAPKVEKIEPPPAPKVDKIEIDAPAVEVDDGKPIEGETVCKLRVRFPGGNMVTKEFGSTRSIAVLFAYCRSVVSERTGAEQRFRIMRMAGRGFEELRDDGASFDDLKLNRDTISVVLDT